MKMKNTIFEVIKYTYYLSLIALVILYLFPGSLIGFLLYSDLGKQPNLISNPIGTSINHMIFFFYLGILGFIVYVKDKKLIFSFPFLFCISILFELLHLIIPNRAFELNDLLANSIGVIFAFFIFKLTKILKN
tara:strand:+ start:507 stop:905 length:399 start_codon:yes stop_codon:yes gene_type:complete